MIHQGDVSLEKKMPNKIDGNLRAFALRVDRKSVCRERV